MTLRTAAILTIVFAVVAPAAIPRAIAGADDQPPAVRLLTRAQILSAIDRMLAANQLQPAHLLTVNDLDPIADVPIAAENPELRVTQIEFEESGRAFRALLWIPGQPKTPPFWVRVRAPLQVLHAASAAPPAPRAPAEPEPPPVLVNAGDRSTLVIEGNGIRILATGIALQRGSLGQLVRVRALATGRIITARVSGERTLSANVAEASQ